MEPTRDAVGQPLAVGDHVAHMRGTSGGVAATRRVIQAIEEGGWLRLVPLSKYRSPPVNPYNVIRIAAP